MEAGKFGSSGFNGLGLSCPRPQERESGLRFRVWSFGFRGLGFRCSGFLAISVLVLQGERGGVNAGTKIQGYSQGSTRILRFFQEPGFGGWGWDLLGLTGLGPVFPGAGLGARVNVRVLRSETVGSLTAKGF